MAPLLAKRFFKRSDAVGKVLGLFYIMSLFLALSLNSSGFSSTIHHCMVAKGNGMNWASTLGWMSESLAIKAKEARAMATEHGEDIKVALNCFAGASSGSGAALLYQGLLGNGSLSSGSLNDPKSPEELMRLSNALRFLAIATDFSTQERNFIASTGLKFFLNMGPVDQSHGAWWERYAFEEEEVLSIIGKYAVVARFISEADFEQSLVPLLPTRLQEFALRHDIQNLTDLPERGALGSPLNLEDQIHLRQLFRIQGTKINEEAERIYKEHGGDSYLWKAFYKEPLADGFCLGAMVEFDGRGLLSENLPSYDRLKTLYMCNLKTVETIRGSAGYQRYLVEKSPFARRAVFATPESLRDVARTSLREFQLFRTQIESLKEAHLSYGLDEKNGSLLETDSQLKLARFGNVGGWVPENVMALPLMWYLFGKDGPDVKLNSLAVFGFLGDGTIGQFSDVWLIRNILGSTSKETPMGGESPLVRSWLKDYKSYQNLLEDLKLSLGSFSSRLQIRYTKANWNLPIFTPSYTGRGIKLLASAINQTRQWEGREGASIPSLFSKWFPTCLTPSASTLSFCQVSKDQFSYYSSIGPLIYVPSGLKGDLTDTPWWKTLGL